MATPENPPAFPAFEPIDEYSDDREKYVTRMLPQDGMTLRDYFAAKAMQAIVADTGSDCHEDIVAKRAYFIADAMLAERAK